jgi:predicted glycoside hydrolase/deacetylase ChbG (UPF0249 family)
MLIINADDLGMNGVATRRILACHAAGRITAASAMTFMADCERASAEILASGIDLGLHLNYTTRFDSPRTPAWLRTAQERTARFLRSGRFATVWFNPLLASAFRDVTQAQWVEFHRLFGRAPTHVDGHHHAHLCMNVLLGGCLPEAAWVRRSFTFVSGEKGALNRAYRGTVDALLQRRHRCVDLFFSLTQYATRLDRLAQLASEHAVELMVHPERSNELDLLMSPVFAEFLQSVEVAPFGQCRPTAAALRSAGARSPAAPLER